MKYHLNHNIFEVLATRRTRSLTFSGGVGDTSRVKRESTSNSEIDGGQSGRLGANAVNLSSAERSRRYRTWTLYGRLAPLLITTCNCTPTTSEVANLAHGFNRLDRIPTPAVYDPYARGPLPPLIRTQSRALSLVPSSSNQNLRYRRLSNQHPPSLWQAVSSCTLENVVTTDSHATT